MTNTYTPHQEGFPTEIVKRTEMLEAVRTGPRTLQELDEQLSMSRSTVHRAIRSLEEQGILRKEDRGYGLTGFGRTVAAEATTFRERLLTARRLEDFLCSIHPTEVTVPIEHFADAAVTQPQPKQAHRGVKRIINFIEEAESITMFSNIISPLYVDVALREMIDGTDIEVIFDESVIDIVLSEYPEEANRALETGRFVVRVADDVPFELFLRDGAMAMAAHDNSARPHVVIETDEPAAIRWAEGLYAEYEARSSDGGLGQLE